MKIFLFLGALNGFFSVAFGAFGAHVLEGVIEPRYLETWQTGVTYLMLHSVALLAIGLLTIKFPDASLLKWSGSLMVLGIILFTGSLFILSITGIRGFAMITPIGGFSFLGGWILLMISSVKLFKKA